MFAPTIKTKMNIIVHGPGAITVEMTTISTKIVEIQFNKDNEYVTVDGRTVVVFSHMVFATTTILTLDFLKGFSQLGG